MPDPGEPGRRCSPSPARYTHQVPWVYILRCADGSYYTGAARDLRRRLQSHQGGTGSRFTRARLPVTLAWCQEVATWGEALREEYRIKRLSRPAKQALVSTSGASSLAQALGGHPAGPVAEPATERRGSSTTPRGSPGTR